MHLPSKRLAAPEQHRLGKTEAARSLRLSRSLAKGLAKVEEHIEHHIARHADTVVFPLDGAAARIPSNIEPAAPFGDLTRFDGVLDRIAAVLERLACRDEG